MKNSHGIIAFIATLTAIVLLSKIGGTGADLAIMTALVSVLGMLAPGLVPSRGRDNKATPEVPQDVRVTNQTDDPVSVTEAKP